MSEFIPPPAGALAPICPMAIDLKMRYDLNAMITAAIENTKNNSTTVVLNGVHLSLMPPDR